MNPIHAYFKWHDAKHLTRALDRRKNQTDIRLLRSVRVPLLVVNAVIFVLLLAALVLTALRKDALAEVSAVTLAVWFAFSSLFEAWVSEALLFRLYISEHGTKS